MEAVSGEEGGGGCGGEEGGGGSGSGEGGGGSGGREGEAVVGRGRQWQWGAREGGSGGKKLSPPFQKH